MSCLLSSYSIGVQRCTPNDAVLFKDLSYSDLKREESLHYSDVLFASIRGYQFYNRDNFSQVHFIRGGKRFDKLKAFARAKKEVSIDNLFDGETPDKADWRRDKADYEMQIRDGIKNSSDAVLDTITVQQVLAYISENNSELSKKVGIDVMKCLQYALDNKSSSAIDSLARACRGNEELCSAITLIVESLEG